MQFWIINFYIFLLLVTFNEAKHKNYGGKYARRGQFPYLASLSYHLHKYCGASIIHERWALTAGHCIYGYDTENYSLRVGTTKLFASGSTYKIEKVYKHPDAVVIPEEENNGLEYVVNDIGLVRLASNISFHDGVQPVLLSRDTDNYGNSMATLAGWGSSVYGEGVHHSLRYINVRLLSLNECRKVWTYADKHVCASTQERRGNCYGDSGSPLVVNGVQVGIASTADTFCESLKPDLYTKVASFVPWIKSIMSKYGDELPDTNDVDADRYTTHQVTRV